MICRKPLPEESRILAHIHSLAFHDFFLTELGDSFLRTYYKAVIHSEESIAVCAMNESNRIIGFATGCEHAKGYNKRLLQNNFTAFALQAVRLIVTKPQSILRLLRNLEKNSNTIDDGNYAELYSIAVLPEAAGLGAGSELIRVFEDSARKKGCSRITLTTDYYNNDSVLAFYKRNGYQIFYDFTTYPQRRMYKMIKEL